MAIQLRTRIAVLTRERLGRQEMSVRQLRGAESDESRFLTSKLETSGSLRSTPRSDRFPYHLKPDGTSRLHLILASKRMEKGIQDAWVEPDAIPGKSSVPLVVILDRIGE